MNREMVSLVMLAFTLSVAQADSDLFASGESQTTLLELFTSEGCSSCPRAETWLSKLAEHPGLWREFVPVAFHVDYWDHLGWKDRFGSPAFTRRQRRYAETWNQPRVYTPGFVVNGREWRVPKGGPLPPVTGAKPGVLQVTRTDGEKIAVHFSAAGEWEAHLALLGNGLTIKVARGENAGRELRHDFVVLHHQSKSMVNGTAWFILPKLNTEPDTRNALAVWVTQRGAQTPVQATGGWLP